MKKSEMVCANCINLEKSSCHLEPIKRLIPTPEEHWCAHGVWEIEAEDGRYGLKWGAWEDE